MKEEIIKQMLGNEKVGNGLFQYLLEKARLETQKKGHVLLRNGDICQHVWYIEKGLVKSRYFDQTGKELISRFWQEKEYILAKYSFNNGVPALEDIVLLEDSILFSINRSQQQHIDSQFPQITKLARKVHIMDDHHNQLRSHMLTETTAEAYNRFCKEFSISRFKQKDIAAYLNRSAQAISKVRRLRQQKK